MPMIGGDKLNPDGSFPRRGIARRARCGSRWAATRRREGSRCSASSAAASKPARRIEVGPGEAGTGVRLVGYGTAVLRGQINLVSAGQPAALPKARA